MKTTKMTNIIAFTLALLFGMSSMQAQIGKRTKDRTEQKVENRVDNKIDRSIDKGLNAIEGLFKKKKKKTDPNAKQREMDNQENTEQDVEYRVNDGNVEVETDDAKITISDDEYTGDVSPNPWLGSFLMTTVSSKNGKQDKNGEAKITFYFDKFKTGMSPEIEDGNSVLMIFDKRKNTSTIKSESDGEKMAIVTKLKRTDVEFKGDTDEHNYEILPTNETKTIQGYQCTKYIIKDADMTQEAWVTQDLGINQMDIAQSMNVYGRKMKGKKSKKAGNMNLHKGLVLESHITFSEKNIKHDYYITNIKVGTPDSKIFSTTGYQIMDMSNPMEMFKQN